MPLTWSEMRLRAARFSDVYRDEVYEKGEAQSFYNDFFEIFGIKRRTVARFETHIRKLNNSSGFIDVFWPGVLIAEHKSYGKDLLAAEIQAGEYFDALPEWERPRYQLICDFQNFLLLDLESGVRVGFKLEALSDHIDNFAFIIGKQKPSQSARAPLTDKACDLVAALYAEVVSSGYEPADAEELTARIIFCYFADSAGIFQPRGLFQDFIESRVDASGRDLGPQLAMLFEVLNKPVSGRQSTLDPDLQEFPYINGSLFSARLSILAGNESMRSVLIAAANFDWAMVSPAIFGTLFDAVMTDSERTDSGSHATGEAVILQVIGDLFLKDLRRRYETALEAGGESIRALKSLRYELSEVRVLDPAAGCGNFLAVTYRELRLLELDIVKQLISMNAFAKDSEPISVVDVDQFYGFEPRRTSRRISEIAMWMTDHLQNRLFELELGVAFSRIPLKARPHIAEVDALTSNWADLLNPSRCSVLIGNPPYLGSKKQKPAQRVVVSSLRREGHGQGTLDLTAAWLLKAADYISDTTKAAFVTTSSIVQGEQVGQLFPDFLKRQGGIEIEFAYQPFEWISPTRGGANVEVVVIGFRRSSANPSVRYIRRLDPPNVVETVDCRHISPYLRSADRLQIPNATVDSTKGRAPGVRKLKTGSKPLDGGYYILSESEKIELVRKRPEIDRYIRPFVGGTEYLYGEKRFIIYLADDGARLWRSIPEIVDLVKKVRAYRDGKLASKDGKRFKEKDEENLADSPTKWHITVVPQKAFLIVPEVTSERRDYIPIGWEVPPSIPSNLVKILEDADPIDFALLTSEMHMSWVRTIGGKLTGRYRYSIDLIYNNFPRPQIDDKAAIISVANDILDARKEFRELTLEAMYDPDCMPDALRRAHRKLDNLVDRAYRKDGFSGDQDRFEFLINLYCRNSIRLD